MIYTVSSVFLLGVIAGQILMALIEKFVDWTDKPMIHTIRTVAAPTVVTYTLQDWQLMIARWDKLTARAESLRRGSLLLMLMLMASIWFNIYLFFLLSAS